MPKKIVITRKLSDENMAKFESPDIELVLWPKDSACDRAWLLENIKGAEGVLCMLSDKMDEEMLDAAGPSLRAISTMSVGYDHLSRALCHSRSISIGYTPDILTDAVADLTVLLALLAMRRGKEAMALVQSGGWPGAGWAPYMLTGPSLTPSTTLGFLGFGRIAQSVLSRLLPFGPKRALYHTRTPRDDAALSKELGCDVEWVDQERLAKEADVLFVLCPGGKSTEGLVGEEWLGRMRETAVLVNTARGSVVDSAALAAALSSGKIFAAGLDVLDGEPNIPADHPLVLEPRCAILPHIGSATKDCRDQMGALSVENVLRGAFGEPLPVELKFE